MYTTTTMSPRQMAVSLLGLAALASARPSNLQPRFSGPIHEHDVRSYPVIHATNHHGAAAAPIPGALASRLIPVVVGGPQDTFVPNIVHAAIGDVIQFQFSSGNHTVTESAAGAPCIALQATDPSAIHSGHIPYEAGQADVGTFNMPVTSTEPLFLFCATGPHCQTGQVMMVNAINDAQLLDYAKLAAGAPETVDGTTVVGGSVASIPLAGAAFVPAPPEEGGAGGPPGGGAGGGGAPPPAAPEAAPAAPPAGPASPASSSAAASSAVATSSSSAAAVAAPSAAPPAEAAVPEPARPSGPKTTLTLFRGRAAATQGVVAV
ncbi:hypothetical protein MN608_10920 [Microdochium nivale]|nr:hypothetical protein MN608_10920 [Microdochium nivale]